MISTPKLLAGAAAAALLSVAGGSAHAANYDINLAGWNAVDDFGVAGNTDLSFSLGAGATINGFSYLNLQFTTHPAGDSWLNELVLSVNNNAATEYFDWAPSPTAGPGVFGPAAGSYGGPVGAIGPYGSSAGPFVLADGIAYVTSYLAYTLQPVGITINSGTLRIDYTPAVPEPGTYAMLAFGLLGVGALVRRRRG